MKLSLIFDLDGTLIDSFDQISRSCIKVRNKLDLRPVLEEELMKFIGLPAETLFSDGPPERLEEAVAMFREELIKEIDRGSKTFPGVVELLGLIRSRRIETAIATSKPHHLAEMVVEKSPLKGLVDYVQGINGFAPKPDPTVILRCQKMIPSDIFVMFGDRPEDIIAGIKSGCYSVGIAQGTFQQNELRLSGAHETFRSIQHLLSNFDEFLNRLLNYG